MSEGLQPVPPPVPRRCRGEAPRTFTGWIGGIGGFVVGAVAGIAHGTISAMNGGEFSDGGKTFDDCIEAGVDMGDRNNERVVGGIIGGLTGVAVTAIANKTLKNDKKR